MADTVLIDIEIPKKGFVNIDADIPEKEAIEVNSREQSFIYHDELFHRDNQNQHPIGAITGLRQELDGKQSNIPDIDAIRSNADAGKQASEEISNYGDIVTHNKNEFATAQQGAKADTAVQPGDLPIVNDKTLTVQRNGSQLGTFSANSSVDKTINILVPTKASDLGALPDTTKYGASLYLSLNPNTFKITAWVEDQDGNRLGAKRVIDLPLESVVVNGSYDSETKKIILTLENGNTVDIPVGDLIAGLQTEITAQNKLSSDLVDDTNHTHKFVTTEEKTTWNNKQDAINDLEDIRSGAALGATALQPSALNGYATQVWVGQQGFLTSTALVGYATEQWVQNRGYITQAVDDDSTTSTTLGWSASKLNGIIGDIESTINAIRGV